MTSENKNLRLSKETLMPLGMVITICAAVVWISSQLTTINHKLDMIESSMQDQWTRRDMENWGLRLKMSNPEIIIPGLPSTQKK
jgi:hypothetical protein